MAKVGEPPHIPQPHTEPHLSQHVLELAVPCWAVCLCCRRGAHLPCLVYKLHLGLAQP